MNRSRSIVLSIVLLTITAAATAQTAQPAQTAPTAQTAQPAQPWSWGFHAGANIYKFSGQSFDGGLRLGYNVGLYAEKQLVGRLGIQPELLVNEVTGKTSDQFNTLFQGASFQNVSLNYITLPILLTYKATDAFTILVGPQYGYLFYQTTGLTNYNPPSPQKSTFTKNDFSILFGGQLSLGRMKLGARYVVGFTQLNNLDDNLDSWKNQGYQLYLTYRIK